MKPRSPREPSPSPHGEIPSLRRFRAKVGQQQSIPTGIASSSRTLQVCGRSEDVMPKLSTIEGCLTALVTPFRGGSLDFDAMAKLVDWQIEKGVDGGVAGGANGES